MGTRIIQTRKLIRFEFIKHLKKNLFPLILYTLAIILLCAITVMCYSIYILPLKNNIKTIESLDYKYVVKTPEDTVDYRCNYKLSNLTTISLDSKRINSNFYISLNKTNSFYSTGDLNPGEICISKQIAERLNVGIGDTILVDLSIYEEPIQFKIANTIPYISDFYNVSDNYDFSVAIIGYDKKLVSQTKGEYISFLTESEYDDFNKKEIRYSSISDIGNELSILKRSLMIATGLISLIIVIILIVYYYLVHKTILAEVIKFYRNGYGKRNTVMFYYLDHVIYVVFPTMVLFFISCVLISIPYSLIVFSLIMLTIIFATIIGGKVFGKVN